MAFLKSVAPEEERRRPRHPPRRPRPPAGEATPVRAPAVAVVTRRPLRRGRGRRGAAGVAKTLKCGECGTLNRPTEWYCERCGAELAGI